MFNIEVKYMNECMRRAKADRQHSIHQQGDTVMQYLNKTYDCGIDAHHVVTKSGDVFEIKRSYDNNYVTLIAI